MQTQHMKYLTMCLCILIQVKYLQDFAEGNNLNIKYHTEIVSVTRQKQYRSRSQAFLLKDQHGMLYQCSILIVR